LGSAGTGVASIPTDLTQGGLNISTIYQGGIQLTIPLRNRIAQADYARDVIQLRQAQGRSQKLENDIRQQVENAAIAIENAYEAYGAAVESRKYQEELLQSEKEKVAVGASTNFLIVQDQAYLAQARSTEVADIKHIDDLGKHFLRELEEFFVNYYKLSAQGNGVLRASHG
jgi:outer membrane protein TolC